MSEILGFPRKEPFFFPGDIEINLVKYFGEIGTFPLVLLIFQRFHLFLIKKPYLNLGRLILFNPYKSN